MVKNILKFFIFVTAFSINSIIADAIIQKKFVIVITSFNNAEWCVKNLETIFFQKNPENTAFYQNYRVIIVDDASVDGNAEYIEQYVFACNQQHRVTLIKNKTRKRAMANLYFALQMCEPDEIVFNYDGDDWLADDQVFNLVNNIYQNPDVWITYGSFINWPTNQMGYCKPIPDEYVEKQLYRKKWWMPGQLRTFYAWLFHQVQLKDLLFEGPYYQGQFFPANADLAIYYPMMEMAGTHFQYIPEVIYIRNVETPINDFKANKDVQVLGSKLLREKSVYARLNHSAQNYFDPFKHKETNIIVFSNSVDSARNFINACNRLMLGVNTIYVLHDNEDEQYSQLQASNVICNKASIPALLHALNKSEYILFSDSSLVPTHYINCSDCVFALEHAFAYGFYLNLGTEKNICTHTAMQQPMPALNPINATMLAWAFHYADDGDWRRYNTTSMALYRTKDVLEQLSSIKSPHYRDLLNLWSNVPINLENVGLCYEHARVGYIN